MKLQQQLLWQCVQCVITDRLILPPVSQQSMSGQLRAFSTSTGKVWPMLFIVSTSG
ncbi:hypothetical protein B7P43_G01586 [Cryptotermes secundus]|uniref:Uncharacterized protein n=1 Tax=Cryptotermes secundus TaxID=105785 RepID=A0A2J7RHW3_9NEOP|nr:hypothetical protein B7P43_G01586 [Cryptotermes secundus]